MTAEERAYNYASTQKPTKLQVGEIAKHYNNGYQQAIKNFMEKALAYLNSKFYFNNAFYGVVSTDFDCMEEMFEDFENYMKNESEN